MCRIDIGDPFFQEKSSRFIRVNRTKGFDNTNDHVDTIPELRGPFYELYKTNFNLRDGHTILLSRHGESEYNVDCRIGGNPPLTPKGQRYANALGAYINSQEIPNLNVLTSSLRRTHMTAAHINAIKSSTSMLDEINSGFMDGYMYADIKVLFPEEYERRKQDKLRYRYPGGESYLDCCSRVINILESVQSQNDKTFLIVAHQGLLRCILGYLLQVELDKIPFIHVPQHAIIKVVWNDGSYSVDHFFPNIDVKKQ